MEKEKKQLSKSLGKNIKGLLVSILIVVCMVLFVPSYRFVWTQFVFGQLSTIIQNPGLSIEQKLALKLGFHYSYIYLLKNNTPENAIILMPSKNDLFPEGEATEFEKGAAGVHNKAWASYFLYPRILVYQEEQHTNPLYAKVTHIAIANYRGYDKLGYEIKSKEKYAVLPITQPLKVEE